MPERGALELEEGDDKKEQTGGNSCLHAKAEKEKGQLGEGGAQFWETRATYTASGPTFSAYGT